MSPSEDHIDLKLKSRLGVETGLQASETYFTELTESIQMRIQNNASGDPEIPKMESGFYIPEDAMDDLTRRILHKIAQEPQDPNIPELTKDTGFSIPELYFEQSHIRVPSLEKVSRIKPLWKRYSSIAAVLILGIGITWWFAQERNTSQSVAVHIPVVSLDSLSNEEIIPVLSEYELDEEVYALAAQMPESNVKQAPAREDSSLNPEQPIEDYLMEHIDELDEI